MSRVMVGSGVLNCSGREGTMGVRLSSRVVRGGKDGGNVGHEGKVDQWGD